MIDYTSYTPKQIAELGLDAAEYSFLRDVERGATNGSSLAIKVGEVLTDNGDWWFEERGIRLIGSDAGQFVPNISAVDGKLATVIQFHDNSIDAYFTHGTDVPSGAQRYTGGMMRHARVHTIQRGWMEKVFAGAASGVQGHFDQKTVGAALLDMEATWALQQQALFDKP